MFLCQTVGRVIVRDIIFVSCICFLGCVVKFHAREANSWRAQILAIEFVCSLSFFLSFFFFSFLLLAFFLLYPLYLYLY